MPPAAAAAETSLLQLLRLKVPKHEILGLGIFYTI
jgi:hypothetical protein